MQNTDGQVVDLSDLSLAYKLQFSPEPFLVERIFIVESYNKGNSEYILKDVYTGDIMEYTAPLYSEDFIKNPFTMERYNIIEETAMIMNLFRRGIGFIIIEEKFNNVVENGFFEHNLDVIINYIKIIDSHDLKDSYVQVNPRLQYAINKTLTFESVSGKLNERAMFRMHENKFEICIIYYDPRTNKFQYHIHTPKYIMNMVL